MQPTIFLLCGIHGSIKVVKISVSQVRIINDIPLASGVLEGVVVSCTREIKPLREVSKHVDLKVEKTNFWMAKLVAFKGQVAFTSKRVRNESSKRAISIYMYHRSTNTLTESSCVELCHEK